MNQCGEFPLGHFSSFHWAIFQVFIGPLFRFLLGHLLSPYWAVLRIFIGSFCGFLLGHFVDLYWPICWIVIGPFGELSTVHPPLLIFRNLAMFILSSCPNSICQLGTLVLVNCFGCVAFIGRIVIEHKCISGPK